MDGWIVGDGNVTLLLSDVTNVLPITPTEEARCLTVINRLSVMMKVIGGVFKRLTAQFASEPLVLSYR